MIYIKEIKPLFTALVTTMDRYEEDESDGSIIKRVKGSIKEYQTVVSIGDCIKNINVGDIVSINPTRYAVKKHQEGSLKDGIITDNPVISYNFNVIELNGVQHLLLQDRDIDYIISKFEIKATPPKSNLILPDDNPPLSLN